MDRNIPDSDFWDRVDQIIDLANKQSKEVPNGDVSASLLYAVSRFNAFITAITSEDKEQLKNNKKEAIEYFSDQYKKMLSENIDIFIENYEEYLKNQK